MSLAPDATPGTDTLADPQALLRVRVGMVSPLWPLFAGAAVSGAAWWWMTRWAQPANLEAMFGAAAKAQVEVAAETVALAEPAVESSEALAEPVIEPITAAVAEAEPVLEAAAAAVEPTVAAAEAVVEAAAEPAVEAVAKAEPVLEAALETAPEALIEAPVALEPVGGEAGPLSPVLEAIAPAAAAPELSPKFKRKPVAPKAD